MQASEALATGGPIQGPMHVLRDLIEQHGIDGSVAKVVARIPDKELEIVNNRDMPDICLQHLLAVMLIDGTVTFKSAHSYRRMPFSSKSFDAAAHVASKKGDARSSRTAI